MTNYEYIVESKENLFDFMERLTARHYGICDVCAYYSAKCAIDGSNCIEGHKEWLDSEYDAYFWET